MEQPESTPAALERLLPAPIGGLALLVLVLGAAVLLREVSDIAVQLLFGGLLALIAWPMLAALRRVGVPAGLALTLTTLVVLGVVIAGIAIIGLSLGELVALIPTYESRLHDGIESVGAFLAQLGMTTDGDALLATVSPEQVASVLQGVASSASDTGLAVVVIALTMIFALAGAPALEVRAEHVLGGDHPIVAGVTHFAANARRYLLVRAQLGLFAAILSFVLLLVLGLPLPALWAALVFAASFIPNIGTWLALIPPTVVALLDIGVGGALAVVLGYGVINFVQDNLLQPMAVGTELNMTPLVGFVGFIVWAWILGPAGAILAIPLTLALAEILEASPSTRALSDLMRSDTNERPGLPPHEATAAAGA